MKDKRDIDGPAGDAERMYLAWQDAQRAGSASSFESLCALHAEHAAEFRRLAEAGMHRADRYREALLAMRDAEPVKPDPAGDDDFQSRLRELGASRGRYRVGRELGRGGMGAVFEAQDHLLGRKVAYKFTIDPRLASARLPFFRRETELAASLSHPGIAGVHDAGVDESGRAFFTMPLVRGRNLSEVLDSCREGRDGWSTIRIVGVLAKVAETMAYVHAQGIIHRDIKPANIRIGEFGEVFVMDWGLAKRIQVVTEPVPLDEEPAKPLESIVARCGTLPYSSPEQWGSGPFVGSATDVYSIGAMLYELLSGRPPFYREEEKSVAVSEILRRMKEEALAPIGADAPRHLSELASICRRAMDPDPSRRYPDCGALAEDLRAFLEQRVVSAHETGKWAEARKWFKRNKALSSALALLFVASLVGVVVFRSQALEASRVNEELLSLSRLGELRSLEDEADTLWPIRPAMVPRYEDWIRRGRAYLAGWSSDGRLGPSASEQVEQLARLRSDPTCIDAAQTGVVEWREELVRAEQRELWMQRMLGEVSWPNEAEVIAGLPPEPELEWVLTRAYALISPVDGVRTYGKEVEARLLLESARARLATPNSRIESLIPWAELFSGRFADVERSMADPVLFDGTPARSRSQDALARELAKWQGAAALAERVREREVLHRKVTVLRRLVEQSSPRTSTDPRVNWWLSQLTPIVSETAVFESDELGGLLSSGVSREHGWGVVRRLEEAEKLRETTIESPDAADRWDRAIREISSSHLYRGLNWPGGRFAPQEGLLPLGPDPRTGLWEFLVVVSGTEPVRNAEGHLQMGEESGVVLVLVPGGTFLMGAQAEDADAPNYDPDANQDEGPVREVALSPYFIGKHEMTQGQWLRFAGVNPSNLRPISEYVTSLAHPVEQVSWNDCEVVLRRMGLCLPTEAQWEFACKGGTGARWWTGPDREALRGKVNIADQSALRAGSAFTSIQAWPDLDDGWPRHAPVGALEPNPFGLHEMHGNVIEWCADAYGSWLAERVTDPCVVGRAGVDRVARGGSYANRAEDCRATLRSHDTPGLLHWVFGVRPARALDEASAH